MERGPSPVPLRLPLCGGGGGSAAAAGDQPQRRVLGTGRERSARGPLFPPAAGRGAARNSAAAAGQRRLVLGREGRGSSAGRRAARPGLSGRGSREARNVGENKRLGNALRAVGTVLFLYYSEAEPRCHGQAVDGVGAPPLAPAALRKCPAK